jgi:hypothetical protein
MVSIPVRRFPVVLLAILLPAGLFAQPLTISKWFGRSSISIGETTTLEFQIANVYEEGPTQTGVKFTDNLPAGLIVATPNGLTNSTCGGGTITATAGSSTISLTGATLYGAFGCVFSVNVTGTSLGVKVNQTGAISSDTDTNGTASASITVNPATVTPTITAQNKTYDGTTAATATCSLSGLLPADAGNVTCAVAGAAFADKNVGSGKIVTATGLSLSGANAGNYALSSTTATTTANITRADLTVTAQNATKVVGAPLPGFSVTFAGFVNGETVAVVSGAPSFTTIATATAPVGNYPIVPAAGTLAAANYSFTFVNGTLVVTARPTLTLNTRGSTPASGFFGQSFTMPGDGPWNN